MEHFCIEKWVDQYVDAVRAAFGDRIWFIGLQGSWGRGEATSASDIDMVLILDTADYMDLKKYSQILDSLPYRDKACGFVSGCAELENWDKSDLFQFCNDTIAIYGSLDHLLESIKREDVIHAVKMGVCNIYHGCVHNAVHEKRSDLLQGLYKSAAFTLRAVAYLEKGIFARKQEDLLPLLNPKEQEILRQGALLQREKEHISDALFDTSAALLIRWTSHWISRPSLSAGDETKFIHRKENGVVKREKIVEQMVDGIVGKEKEDENTRRRLTGRALEYLMFIDDEE